MSSWRDTKKNIKEFVRRVPVVGKPPPGTVFIVVGDGTRGTVMKALKKFVKPRVARAQVVTVYSIDPVYAHSNRRSLELRKWCSKNNYLVQFRSVSALHWRLPKNIAKRTPLIVFIAFSAHVNAETVYQKIRAVAPKTPIASAVLTCCYPGFDGCPHRGVLYVFIDPGDVPRAEV